jgi:phytoene/squalene synthetase
MRQDLSETVHTKESFEKYVYGSAEVVGLMCLAVFMAKGTYSPQEKDTLVRGARALGSAFQKVNFLRDLAADFKSLGRSYFPGVSVESFDEATKMSLVRDIDSDLAVSSASLNLLPSPAKRAVAAAQLLFESLNRQIEKTPASQLISRRVSVGRLQKLLLLAKAVLGARA